MTRSRRWLALGGAVAGALAALAIAAIGVARSDWLRDKIRAALVEQTERATGGRVEIGALRFDWPTLTVHIERFTIHGSESAGASPLLTVERAAVELKIVSFWRRDVRLGGVDVVRPQAHLIVYADGSTNLPRPKLPLKQSPVEMILDLQIARFDLKDGGLLLDTPGRPPHLLPWSVRGESLVTKVAYDPGAGRYDGSIAVGAARISPPGFRPIDVSADARAALERNRIVVALAKIAAPEGVVTLSNAVLRNFADPTVTGNYAATISLRAIDRRLGGNLQVAGSGRYRSPADYMVSGNATSSGISFNQFRASRLDAVFDADPDRVAVTRAELSVLGGGVSGTGEILHWDNPADTIVRAKGAVRKLPVSQTARLFLDSALPYDGVIGGPFQAQGRLRSLKLDADLSISPATSGAAVRGEIAAHFDRAAGRLDLGESWLELPHSRIDLSGTLGARLAVKLNSADPSDFRPFLSGRPAEIGARIGYRSLNFTGTVTGPLQAPHIAGRAAAEAPEIDGRVLDSAGADIEATSERLSGSGVQMAYGGIRASGGGAIALEDWIATDRSAISARLELPASGLDRILELAGHKEVPVSGALAVRATVSGALSAPAATAEIVLSKGFVYGQPFDSLTGTAQYPNAAEQSFNGLFVSGPKRVNIGARFSHAGTQFPAGDLEFNLTSNTMPLNQIALVRERQPDILGFGKFHADGVLRIAHDAKHELRFDLLGVNADASANGLELAGRNLGDARFTAQTRTGVVSARFDSNAAGASITGEGSVKLQGDYPVDARVHFSNAGLNSLAMLISKASDARTFDFDGSAEAELNIAGPARVPEKLTAAIDIPRIEIHALPGTPFARGLPGFSIGNDGPIRATLTAAALRVERARLKAPETDVSLTGEIAIQPKTALNLRVEGSMNLALAHIANPDLASSGLLSLDTNIRGDLGAPDVSGRAILRNGDFHYSGFSNGLTNSAGEIVFNGTRAVIQSLSAESGGGKVDATGFAALSGGLLTFRIETRARGVRVRYPEGVSSISDANLTLAGTSQRSEVSGAITVHRVAVNPKSDAASILSLSSQPLQTVSAQTGALAGMNLDVQISTAPDAAIQTSVTQSIQADANLRLRGTVTNPAVLGRVNVTQGEVVFFGNKYSINQGSVSFFNPAKIEPILNVDLETKARGVDVVLTVSGPMNKLNVNYRSDPPLQFSDIVALLATGRAPTDPTVGGAAQGFQQLGASELVGQAIANPVAGRLQRFFGVSRLKIDPQLTGITGSPQARLTVEQQVTPEILFTYITDVSSTSTQLIRVEWAFNPRWSAILIREENGYVGLDFAYRKRFR